MACFYLLSGPLVVVLCIPSDAGCGLASSADAERARKRKHAHSSYAYEMSAVDNVPTIVFMISTTIYSLFDKWG